MSESTHPSLATGPPENTGPLPPLPLHISVNVQTADGHPAVLITVAGELDSIGASLLQSAWDSGVDGFPPRAVLDLQRVDYCNAAGLRVLAHIRASCRARDTALDLTTSPRIDWLLNLLGLTPDLEGWRAPKVAEHHDRPGGEVPRPGGGPPTGGPPLPPQAIGRSDTATGPFPALTLVAPYQESADAGLLGQVNASVQWARTLAVHDVEETLAAVLDAAGEAIEGLECASIMLLEGRDQPRPRASGGPLCEQLDALQLSMRQGPGWHSCLRATDVFVDDLQDTYSVRRWPHLTAATAELPVRAVMSVHLSTPSRPLGCLTLLATRAGAFDDGARGVAQVLAAVASLSLAAAIQRQQLTAAVASRDVIGQAKGILMERLHLTADQAFTLLQDASSRTNTKLSVLASQITLTGELVTP